MLNGSTSTATLRADSPIWTHTNYCKLQLKNLQEAKPRSVWLLPEVNHTTNLTHQTTSILYNTSFIK